MSTSASDRPQNRCFVHNLPLVGPMGSLPGATHPQLDETLAPCPWKHLHVPTAREQTLNVLISASSQLFAEAPPRVQITHSCIFTLQVVIHGANVILVIS